jgi:four helix bundle protein
MNWKDLKVWQKAHDATIEIYKITSRFPKEEIYGITNQIRRSSSSMPANIVEGQSRNTTEEYLQFLHNSRGSLEETRYHLLLSKDLGYFSEEKYQSMEGRHEEVSKMLNSLNRSLKKKE